MSDRRLRDLERRWKETGAVEDEATWLRARVRVGEITEDSLQLACRLGRGAAAVALGLDLRTDGEDYLQASDSFYDQPWSAAEAKIKEFGAEFDRLQALAEAVLGPPDESDEGLDGDDPNAEPKSFAEWMYWRGVVRLAAWHVAPGRVGFLAVEHQDKEVPVFLILGLEKWSAPGTADA